MHYVSPYICHTFVTTLIKFKYSFLFVILILILYVVQIRLIAYLLRVFKISVLQVVVTFRVIAQACIIRDNI